MSTTRTFSLDGKSNEDEYILVSRASLAARTESKVEVKGATVPKTSSDESKILAERKIESKASLFRMPRYQAFLKGGTGRQKDGKSVHFRSTITGATQLSVLNSAAKYLLATVGGTVNLTVANCLSLTSEISSWITLFDEIFCHGVSIHFEPRNQFSSNSSSSTNAAGSPGDLNTLGVVVAAVQHNQTAYSDASTAVAAMLASETMKIANLAKGWTFRWRNIEKYDPDGPVINTSGVSQSWINTTQTANYGGLVQFATTAASGASVGLGTLLENGIFGDLYYVCDISLRFRS